MFLLALLLQFEVTRGFRVEPPAFAVSAAPAFDVRPGRPDAAVLPTPHPVTVARDRAAREGRVLIVWVGTKDERLAASLPPDWVQAGPVSEYGGEAGPGVAVGVPHDGALYYRGVIPARWEAIHAEVRRLSPAPAVPMVPQVFVAPRRQPPPVSRNC